jgi:hypothetical protein
LFTTNFIQSRQVCLSILIEVLALILSRLNTCVWHLTVNKVGGIYHKLLISIIHMVMWYNGSASKFIRQELC